MYDCSTAEKKPQENKGWDDGKSLQGSSRGLTNGTWEPKKESSPRWILHLSPPCCVDKPPQERTGRPVFKSGIKNIRTLQNTLFLSVMILLASWNNAVSFKFIGGRCMKLTLANWKVRKAEWWFYMVTFFTRIGLVAHLFFKNCFNPCL